MESGLPYILVHVFRSVVDPNEGGGQPMSHRGRARSSKKGAGSSLRLRVGLTIFAVIAFLAVWVFAPRPSSDFTPSAWQQALDFGKRQLGFPSTPEHPYIFPYSVSPGGIHSLAQLKAAIERDPVDARAYADFNLAKYRMIKLKKDEYAYVAYRIGDGLFWSSKKVKLCEGESLLTDGVHFIRARCGNPISEVPDAQIWAEAPPDALPDGGFSSPVETEPFAAVNPYEGQPGNASIIPPSPLFPETPTFTPVPPQDFVPPFFGVITPPLTTHIVPPRHNTPVPEDSTLLLVVTGVAALAYYWRRRRISRLASNASS